MFEHDDDFRRIVVIAKAFPPVTGGVETYSEQVVLAYLRAGYAVDVLTQTDGPAGWREVCTAQGVFRLWNAGPGGQLSVFRRMVGEARRLARKSESIVGVHSTTWRVGIVGQLAFGSTPRVVTVHGREVLNFPVGAAVAMRHVFLNATTVLAVSSETRAVALAAVKPKDATRWHTSYNGLTDTPRAATVPSLSHDARVRLLSLCRLVPRKNVVRAVEAIALLAPDVRKRIEFRIAGRGPEGARIEQIITDAGLSESVTLLGFVADEDVRRLYDWADIFVHPHSHVGEGTDFEGFGIAIADAMAHGCAVISGRDGGPKDFVLDGETGLMVDGNETAAVADAIARLVADTQLREHVAEKGRDYAVGNFSWDLHIAPALADFSNPRSNR